MISNRKILILLSIVCLNIFFLFTNFFYAQLNNTRLKTISSINNNDILPLSTTSSWSSVKKFPYEELLKLKPSASDLIQQKTVEKLVQRLLPKHYKWFVLKVNGNYFSENNLDRFKIQSNFENKTIKITGTTGVAIANGFHYYLKYITNSSISWSGSQVNLSNVQIPLPKIAIEMTIREKFRYYQNACTISYSMVWWKWSRWEREIDWMALQGINFPLAFAGQELIFRRTFQRFNFTTEEINEYFTGPAYLAWNRMGNIQTWSGPLTEHWHQQQMILQRKILKRMRAFGMYPIVPGFAGHVPRTFKNKIQTITKINRLANWNHFGANFSETDFLEPEDPYFVKIGKVFIEEYIKIYGTDNFYNIDMFVEETPSSRNFLYLQKCGLGVYESIRQADPNGRWVLQGYPFNSLYDKFWGPDQVKALISAIPDNKIIILDIIAEVIPIYPQVDGYFGKPFIWCILHNYGGVSGMFGSLNRINHNGVFEARNKYANMLGVGIAPEGIEQNDIVYDYMMEVPWHDQAPNMTEWFSKYAIRRYGIEDKQIDQAWQLLRTTVYHDPIGIKNHGKYSFVSRPRPNLHSMLWYNPKDMAMALKLFVKYVNSNPKIVEQSSTFVHDLIDISRQTLQLVFDYHYAILDKAFEAKKLYLMQTSIAKLNETLELTEMVLGSCQNCLLYNWIQQARLWGNDSKEQDYNEWQARTQISIWGPRANIANYAAKQWSGMFRYLFKPRWQLYFDEIIYCIQQNETFKRNEFKLKLFNLVELPFTLVKKQELLKKADTSNLILNVNKIVKEVELSIDLQKSFKFYYNDTERWLE